MKLENQCISLQQAKRLKELGITQDSTFYMWHSFGANPIIPMISFGWDYYDVINPHYSAFTVAELGVMLPDSIPTNSNIRQAELIIRRDCLNEWITAYDVDYETEGGYGATVKAIYGRTFSERINEAISRAAMLIHLIESGKTTAADCNARLLQ